MKNSAKHILAAAALAAIGFVAVAQTPAPYGAAAGSAPAAQERTGHFDPAKRQARIAERQARLKQKLQITAAQDAAWNNWTAAMQPPANWKRPDRAEFEGLSTPERIDRMRALRTERMARMDKRGDATKALYAVLTTEQKKVFDEEAAGRRHRGHHRHHMG